MTTFLLSREEEVLSFKDLRLFREMFGSSERADCHVAVLEKQVFVFWLFSRPQSAVTLGKHLFALKDSSSCCDVILGGILLYRK